MLLKYILPHLKSKSSLKITCFMIYTPDQTIFKFQISFKSEINFHVSCFLLTTHHYVYSCCGTQQDKKCRSSCPACLASCYLLPFCESAFFLGGGYTRTVVLPSAACTIHKIPSLGRPTRLGLGKPSVQQMAPHGMYTRQLRQWVYMHCGTI